MRLLLLALLALPGCTAALLPLAAAETASVTVFGRGIADLGFSAISGRDCSIVRLDRGKSYCVPLEPPYEPPPFCTRTLADVVCWADPEHFTQPPRPVADGPPLTPPQEINRVARWPKSLALN